MDKVLDFFDVAYGSMPIMPGDAAVLGDKAVEVTMYELEQAADLMICCEYRFHISRLLSMDYCSSGTFYIEVIGELIEKLVQEAVVQIDYVLEGYGIEGFEE